MVEEAFTIVGVSLATGIKDLKGCEADSVRADDDEAEVTVDGVGGADDVGTDSCLGGEIKLL